MRTEVREQGSSKRQNVALAPLKVRGLCESFRLSLASSPPLSASAFSLSFRQTHTEGRSCVGQVLTPLSSKPSPLGWLETLLTYAPICNSILSSSFFHSPKEYNHATDNAFFSRNGNRKQKDIGFYHHTL